MGLSAEDKKDIRELVGEVVGVKLDSRFEVFEGKVDAKLDSRFELFEEKVDTKLDSRFELFEEKIDAKLDSRFELFEEKVDVKLDSRFESFALMVQQGFAGTATKAEMRAEFEKVHECLVKLGDGISYSNQSFSLVIRDLDDVQRRLTRVEERLGTGERS